MSSPKIAIITGAGTGIGKATAQALLGAGYRVTLAGRRAEPLHAVVAELSAKPDEALVVPTDVADPASVKAMFAATVQKWGRVDVLFNNAGVGAPGVPLEELTIEQWKQVVDINLNGMFYCIQQAFMVMKAQSPQGGRIINNGSISAHAPRPASIAYTTTKHAITGLTKAANLDGRAFQIAVGQIDIGNVASDMTQAMAQGIQQANGGVMPEARMDMQGVVDTVMNMAHLPLSANVLFTTIMATNMPFVGRG